MWTKRSRFDFVASRGFTVPGEELYSPSTAATPEAAAIAWFAISTANEIRRKVLGNAVIAEVDLGAGTFPITRLTGSGLTGSEETKQGELSTRPM